VSNLLRNQTLVCRPHDARGAGHALGHVDEAAAGPTAVFSAANLLSPTGITDAKYSRT
jgi:hypothetical protein